MALVQESGVDLTGGKAHEAQSLESPLALAGRERQRWPGRGPEQRAAAPASPQRPLQILMKSANK